MNVGDDQRLREKETAREDREGVERTVGWGVDTTLVEGALSIGRARAEGGGPQTNALAGASSSNNREGASTGAGAVVARSSIGRW